MWVRSDAAFQAVVDAESFFVARGIIQERNRVFTDEEMLTKLRQLHAQHRELSASLIDDADGVPTSSSFRNRFGSLIEAYRLIGFDPGHNYDFIQVNRRLRSFFPDLLGDTIQQLQGVGATVQQDEQTDKILINGEYSALLVLGRCKSTSAGRLGWHIRLEQERPPDITIAVRMDAANERPTDFYLLPFIDIGNGALRLGETNAAPIETYRFETLEFFVEMAARARIEVAA
jgi:hypothetical protein